MKRLLLLFVMTASLFAIGTTAKTIDKKTLDNNTAYITGYANNTFRPNNTITRAEAVTIIARLLEGEENIPQSESGFSDVSGHWAEKYIACLEKEGLLERYENNFLPDKPITRAEFAELAVNTCSVTKSEPKSFDDVPDSHPFYEAISASASAGLVGGYEDNTFRPDNTITRAEAVTVINRVQGIETNSNVFGQNYNKLRNFSDIKSHWARYNILVASNAGVGKYVTPVFGNLYLGGISMKNKKIVLENDYFSYIIESNGYLSSMIDKSCDKELLAYPTSFIYAKKDGNGILPKSATLENSEIVFTLMDNTSVTIRPTVKDSYIIFEITDYRGDVDTVSFANTTLDYTVDSDTDISVLGVSLSSLALTQYLPKITARQYCAVAYSKFGIEGAKYAILATPEKYHLSALEALSNDCDITEGIFAASRFDSEEKRLVNTNYFLGSDGNHETVFDKLDLYTALGIDMYSFHKGNNTFRQGDFLFHNQSLKTAYQSVLSTYIQNAGLGTRQLYSYYMTPDGSKLLPEAHSKEFEYIGTYKLSDAIKTTTRQFKLDGCTLTGKYYIALGNELIFATIENGEVTDCDRKAGGTSRYEHQKGRDAVIINITGTGAHNFKALVSDPLREKGIMSGLHTYAFYIDPECSEFLSDPKWQSQFIIQEEYTLAEDITATDKKIKTVEGLEKADLTHNYRSVAWDLIFIDNELIQINVSTMGNKTITCTKRGHLETDAVEHKAGTKIRRIASYYSGLAPQMCSELYYEVAKRTGEAFNDGGFDMVYFDAIDGVKNHIPTYTQFGDYDYYTTEFLRETLEHCNTKPITEVYVPTQYVTHSYTPAFDYANKGYKEFMEYHSEFNKTYLNSYYFATMGWYNFYPLNEPANTMYEYQHTDDIDRLGTLSLAYNYSMVFTNLESYNANAKNKANIDRYVQYDKLRKEGYFPESITEQLKDSKYEYSLVNKGENNWTLVEKSYDKARLHNLADSYFNYIEGENPFEAQSPFIRIEADWSSKGENPVVLASFDKNAELTSQQLRYEFTKTVDATGRHALQVSVYGNGSGGAICISLDSPNVSDQNQIDYVIPIDFTGWKDFTLVATDTAMYPKEYFSHWAGRDTYNFKIYRGPVDFSNIMSMTVYTYGSMSGVKMGDVVLTSHENAPLVNPSVTLGNGQSITFKCTINSSEYLEYDGKTALIYNKLGNTRQVTEIKGSIRVPKGSYKAKVTAENTTGMIQRGKVTFGFTGEELK